MRRAEVVGLKARRDRSCSWLAKGCYDRLVRLPVAGFCVCVVKVVEWAGELRSRGCAVGLSGKSSRT